MNEFDDMLPEQLLRELQRDFLSPEPVRGRVMAAVRRDGLAVQRGGWLAPAVGVAVAATLVIGALIAPVARWSPATAHVATAGAASAIDSALRDTLMLIRFAMTSPRAASVALVGDFNGWRPGATALDRTSRAGEWTATVAVAPGTHRYAFVVDDTQWVTPGVSDAAAPNGRRASRLIVPKPD